MFCLLDNSRVIGLAVLLGLEIGLFPLEREAIGFIGELEVGLDGDDCGAVGGDILQGEREDLVAEIVGDEFVRMRRLYVCAFLSGGLP